MKRLLIVLTAACFPTLAVMFCAARTDLMDAPVSVRFACLVMAVVAGIAAFALTDRAAGVAIPGKEQQ